jgi:hypothetical protein
MLIALAAASTTNVLRHAHAASIAERAVERRSLDGQAAVLAVGRCGATLAGRRPGARAGGIGARAAAWPARGAWRASGGLARGSGGPGARAAAWPASGGAAAGTLTLDEKINRAHSRGARFACHSFDRTGGIQRHAAVSDGIRCVGSAREACSASTTLGRWLGAG